MWGKSISIAQTINIVAVDFAYYQVSWAFKKVRQELIGKFAKQMLLQWFLVPEHIP